MESLRGIWDLEKIPTCALKLDNLLNFCLCWVFVAVNRLSLVAVSGGYSLVVVLWLLTAVAFLVASTGSKTQAQ